MISCKDEIRDAIEAELISAKENHGLFASPHEAYAVTLEELEEAANELMSCNRQLHAAWESIKEDNASSVLEAFECLKHSAEHLAQEACQVAAMAIKAEQSIAELTKEHI